MDNGSNKTWHALYEQFLVATATHKVKNCMLKQGKQEKCSNFLTYEIDELFSSS